MERYVPLKETMRFSVCNKSFLLKERPVGLKPTGSSFKTKDALVLNQRSLGLKPTEAHFSESLKVKNLYHHEETYLYGNPRIVYPGFLQQ